MRDHRLSDPVRDRGHPEHLDPPPPLRYLHRPHRRREVAPRRHPIPELVQVPLQVRLELLDRLLVDARRALVGLDPPIRLPDHPLGDLKRLSASARSPGSSRPPPVDHQANQDDPSPSLRPHYRASPLLRDGPPLCPASVLSPSQFPPLGVLPPAGRGPTAQASRHRGDRFPRSAPEPGPSSRHLHAGHRLASQQAPARLIPGQRLDPGFDAIDTLSTRHQWFALARLLDSTPDALTARLFRDAHHPGS